MKKALLYQILVYITDGKTKKKKKKRSNNEFKISAPTWNDEFELPDESCSMSDIQDLF